jgi:enoyl-CoA hydratase
MSVAIERDGDIAIVTLERPESRNALSDSLLGQVVDQLEELDRCSEVGCVVIAGQERFFSAGADVSELANRDAIDVLLGRRAGLWRAMREVRVPLVAAVSGYCLGGGFELALSCDLIVASRSARFGQPETALGIIPGGGGSQHLVGLVGRVVAADMILTGRRLDADEAHRRGIVARLCDEDWREQAIAVAHEIARRPRVGQMLAKQALWAALELPLAGGIRFERTAFQVALSSADAREGLTAFTESRPPVWQGR